MDNKTMYRVNLNSFDIEPFEVTKVTKYRVYYSRNGVQLSQALRSSYHAWFDTNELAVEFLKDYFENQINLININRERLMEKQHKFFEKYRIDTPTEK